MGKGFLFGGVKNVLKLDSEGEPSHNSANILKTTKMYTFIGKLTGQQFSQIDVLKWMFSNGCSRESLQTMYFMLCLASILLQSL